MTTKGGGADTISSPGGGGFSADPSTPSNRDDTEEGATTLAGSTGGAPSPFTQPKTGESGDGALDSGGDDLDDAGSVETTDLSGGLRARARRLAEKLRNATTRTNVAAGNLMTGAADFAGKHKGLVGTVAVGVVAVGAWRVGSTLFDQFNAPSGSGNLASNLPTGGGSGRPRTGLATELISTDRPSSGSDSATLDTVNQPRGRSGGSTEALSVADTARDAVKVDEAATAATTPGTRQASPPMELIDSDRPTTGGGSGAGEVASQQAPAGVKTDGHGNYTTTLGEQWDGSPTELSGYYHKGSLDGRVADILIENGADRSLVNGNPDKVHQISMRIYADSGFGPDKQYTTGAHEVLTIRPSTVEQINREFGGSGFHMEAPDSPTLDATTPGSGGGSGQVPGTEAEAPGGSGGSGGTDSGGAEGNTGPSNGGEGTDEPQGISGEAAAITAAFAAAAGASLYKGRKEAKKMIARRRADRGTGGGGGGDTTGRGPDTATGPDPAELAALETAFRERLRLELQTMRDRITALTAAQAAAETAEQAREAAEEAIEEEWQEKNGQFDLDPTGPLAGNIDELNSPTTPEATTYRDGLINEAVATAQLNAASGVTDAASFQTEANAFVDRIFGAGRPTEPGGPGVLDAAFAPVADSLVAHRTSLYDGVTMTDAAGADVAAPTAINTPNQLRVPVGNDGRILPGFLDNLNRIINEARTYNQAVIDDAAAAPGATPATIAAAAVINDQFVRMLGDTDDGMEPQIPLQQVLVAAGATFVRGAETP